MAGLYEAPSLSTIKVGQFKGADSSVPEDQMKPYRAARSENMIPDAAGEVCKRPGVQWEKTISDDGDFLEYVYKKDDEGNWVQVKEIGTIVEVIDGKHLVIKRKELLCNTANRALYSEENVDVYRIYFYDGSEYKHLIGLIDKKPVCIKYGDGYMIFAANGSRWRGKYAIQHNNDQLHDSDAAVIFVNNDGVIAYTSSGFALTLGEDGEWAGNVISEEDERLTTPIILIGCDPAGGGNAYQKVNLLNPWVTESFCCKENKNAIFYLHNVIYDTDDYDVVWKCSTEEDKFNFDQNIRIKVLVSVQEGEEGISQNVLRWVNRWDNENDAFRPAVNRLWIAPEGNLVGGWYKDVFGNVVNEVNVGTGEENWIGATPKDGEDNVRITHWRADFEERFIELCDCVCGTTFGVAGYKDRLVIGGGNQQKNRVYYSELEDPFYIGDLNFIETEAGSSVMAVDGTDDTLAILTDQGIYFSQATAQNNTDDVLAVSDALFTTSAKIPAPAPINIGNTAVLGGEIVYLSAEGVIAVAYKEHFATRFAEHRSALIDRVMLADQPQQLVSLGRFLMIRCADGVWWLLDENQPNNEGDKPYSSHQYEGFRLTGMVADTAWAEGETLKLIAGTAQCRWMEGTLPEHYHDNYTNDDVNDKEIAAWWETPYIYGSNFYRKKIFMKLGLLLGQLSYVDESGAAKFADTAVLVEGKKNEEDWKVLWPYDGTLCSFDYGNIDYSLFTYASAPGCPDISRKIKIKKAQRFKLRFTNDFIDQPFILREFGLDYVQED